MPETSIWWAGRYGKCLVNAETGQVLLTEAGRTEEVKLFLMRSKQM
jgi:hypothetical protein